MIESDRKLLTEFLGESDHTQTSKENNCLKIKRKDRATCSCGYCCKTDSGLKQHIIKFTRTFTTWSDLGAVKDKLVEVGKWEEFCKYAFDQTDETGGLCYVIEVELYDAVFLAWLFRPTNERGEAHFCQLAADYIKQLKGDERCIS
jgi:hypothetical protein